MARRRRSATATGISKGGRTQFAWLSGFGPDKLAKNAIQYGQNMRHIVYGTLAEAAPEIERYMKQEHPWQNQTGAAEEGLHVSIIDRGGRIDIILAHGEDVEYGIWLEVRWAGKYAIIKPSIDIWGPEIMRRVQRAIR